MARHKRCPRLVRRGEDSLAGPGEVHVERSPSLHSRPAEVYAVWRNFENLPRFLSHLEQVQVRGNGSGLAHSHWIARGPQGLPVEWEVEMVEDRAGQLIAWRSLPGSQVDHSGVVEIQAAGEGAGAQINIALQYAPPMRASGAVLGRIFGPRPEAQLHDDLRRFKRLLESGRLAAAGSLQPDWPEAADTV
ncbi:MAG: SRPBCC family protein [Anaerolineaceae bacterium]|nr:SRPBCC family protein [Anaerolineaceae bacterium]